MEVWEAGLKGEATLKEFRGTLIKWYSLHTKGIEIYEWERGAGNNRNDTTHAGVLSISKKVRHN
ncbi:hypothetical protein ES708_32180 [subsurface metagenome]